MKIIEEGTGILIKLDVNEEKPKIQIRWKVVCHLCGRVKWAAWKPRKDRRSFCRPDHAMIVCGRDWRKRQQVKHLYAPIRSV